MLRYVGAFGSNQSDNARGATFGRRLSLLAAATVAILIAAMLSPFNVAGADKSPIANRPTGVVTADGLPTAQIDGVAWTQQVVGNTVYVGGKFGTARPAGSAAGQNQTTRNNLMAYTLSTGVMTSWNPNADAQILASALSPDGTRLYVAGNFQYIGSVRRSGVAAFDTATGNLITSFAPGAINGQVSAITATNTAVYFGGSFSNVGTPARSRLAAVSASNGALLPWNPGANTKVFAMTMNPSKSLVIVGGSFDQIAGTSAMGLAALDPTTGARTYWAATDTVSAYGVTAQGGAAIYSLSADNSNVYGTAYNFYGYGNLEGTFSANGDSGAINWVEDCHGDTYSVFANSAAVYTLSHAHYCGNIGGYPQSDPWSVNEHHALAFTKDATGTIGHDPLGYADWYGTKSPSLINWFPDLTAGKVTGQAAWSVTGNSDYVVVGGEFPTVNNGAQAGLVRFAVPAKSTNKQGPRLGGSMWTANVTPLSNTMARVSIPANWDRDNTDLTYTISRNGRVVYTTTATSQFWNRPTVSFMDSGLTAGQVYNYQVRAVDPDGNSGSSAVQSVTMPTNMATSQYLLDVLNDGAGNYWRLGEPSGSTAADFAGSLPLTNTAAVTEGVDGAVLGDANTAYSYTGNSDSYSASQTPVQGPDLFTEEVWFKTTTTVGGKIMGFGNASSGNSSSYDRHIFMNPGGQVSFGVYNGNTSTITSGKPLNDGQWHQAVASLSSAGMAFYVDGKKVGSRADVTNGQSYSGYWRIGGDSSWSGSNYFNGSIDEPAVYPTALTLAQIQQHYTDSGRTLATTPSPTDAYGKAVYKDSPDVYYRMADTTSKAVDASGNGNDGLYSGGYTQGAAGSPTGGGAGVTFNGSDGTLGSAGPISGPSTYSEESWFKTTTTSGGKIMGFGDQQTGNSGNYDRHVYMTASGQLTFGAWTGQANLATSTASYNDGNWHYVVATQGSDGMKLYVDGALVGVNAQTSQQPYSGYWRVGGDSSWADSNYFAGTIDEAAFYSSVLTPAQITAHYSAAAINHAPTASFSVTNSNLVASVDASASSDPDQGDSVASYVWDFGDNSAPVTTTSPTTTHTYTSGGSYTISLTVKDSAGMSSAPTTKPVTVAAAPPNVPPVAAFASTVKHNVVTFDGTGSADSDGTITGYDWNFGDGSAHSTQVSPSHTYTGAGDYSVTLTVTDNQGAQNSVTKTVSAQDPNKAPVVQFSSSVNGLVTTFSSAGTTDSDGTITGLVWDFGDNSGTSTSQNPSYTYTKSGTYTVTLTATDDDGATTTKSGTVTIANQPPTAAFTATPSQLSVAFDGTGSTDPENDALTYAWDFGGGATSTQATPTYTFAASGTYPVKLTVDDGHGNSDTTTKQVTVTGDIATDTFTRTVTNGWGSADRGGAWTTAKGASVNGSTGLATVSAPGSAVTSYLSSVSAADVNYTVDNSVPTTATGGGFYSMLIARNSSSGQYRLKVIYNNAGGVQLQISKVISGTETALKTITVSGLTYTGGDIFHLRFVVKGTSLSGTVWKGSANEPATPQLSVTDSTAALQGPGSVGYQSFVSGTATNTPATFSWDNLSVKPA